MLAVTKIVNPTEEATLLEKRIAVFRGQINAIRSDMQDTHQINKAIDLHFTAIQTHQGEIDKLIWRRNNLQVLLDQNLVNLREMNRRLKSIRDRHAITRMTHIREQLLEMGVPEELLQ